MNWSETGFRRLDEARRATSARGFTDELVSEVVTTLRRLKQEQGGEFVDRSNLLFELNRLFNRKTFRFESLRSCPEQRWVDRLDSAYQTEKALREWERNVAKVAQDKYQDYVELIGELGSYCMHMGVHLFAPPVDVHRIKPHIGEPTFEAQLTPPIRFPVDPAKLPIIPDEINDPIERHRRRLVRLADQLGVSTSSG